MTFGLSQFGLFWSAMIFGLLPFRLPMTSGLPPFDYKPFGLYPNGLPMTFVLHPK